MDLDFSQFDFKQEAGNREKVYFAVILLLIFVSFSRWLYIPKLQQTKVNKIEIKNQKMQIETLKQFAQIKLPEQLVSSGPEDIKTATKFEKAVEESMKSQQQVVAEIVRLLSSSNVLNGIVLTGLTFGSEVNKGMYISIPVSIDIEGKYSGILGYLAQIEKFGKLVIADNIEMTTSKENPTVVHGKVQASIYVVQKDAAKVQAVGKTAPAGKSARGK